MVRNTGFAGFITILVVAAGQTYQFEQAYSLEQTEDWLYMEFMVEKHHDGQFLLVEYESPMQPAAILLASVGTRPTVTSLSRNTWDIQAEFVDRDGWQQSNNAYQFIQIEKVEAGQTIHVCVFNTGQDGTNWSYSIRASLSENPVCPQDCTGNGICGENTGACKCLKEFIGQRCESMVTQLDIGETAVAQVLSMEWTYFSIEIRPDDEAFDLTCQTMAGSEPFFEVYGVTQITGNLTKPNPWNSSFVVKLDGNSLKEAQIDVGEHGGSRLILGVLNAGLATSSIELTIEYASTESSETPLVGLKEAVIFISTAVSLTTVAAIVIYFKCCKRKPRGQARVAPEMNETAIPNVQSKFPMKMYGNVCDDKNATCSICLEYFTSSDQIRELSCHHVFHVACIDTWFSQNNRCCLCKQEMNAGRMDLSEEQDSDSV